MTSTESVSTGTDTTVAPRSNPHTPLGVNHLVLNVRNMEESHRFWCELLGFKQVGELEQTGRRAGIVMRFYSGVVGDVNHHDVALVESPALPAPTEEWGMFAAQNAINHIAITYADRQTWMEQVKFLVDNGVKVARRVDHGMTHSIYVSDPNGYGIEVLYELPAEVWNHDINGALNFAVDLPTDHLVDTEDYETNFKAN